VTACRFRLLLLAISVDLPSFPVIPIDVNIPVLSRQCFNCRQWNWIFYYRWYEKLVFRMLTFVRHEHFFVTPWRKDLAVKKNDLFVTPWWKNNFFVTQWRKKCFFRHAVTKSTLFVPHWYREEKRLFRHFHAWKVSINFKLSWFYSKQNVIHYYIRRIEA